MFEWLNSQAVRHDSGFEVESMGRFSIEYREGPMKLDIEVENGFVGSNPCVIVSRGCFSCWNGKSIGKQEQDRLLANFIAAMEFQGLGVLVSD